MEYTKMPIDIPEQISILKNRGLVIGDATTALLHFSDISYFRLASYWKTFEIDSASHELVTGTSLHDVLSLYAFDRELRGVIFAALPFCETVAHTMRVFGTDAFHGNRSYLENYRLIGLILQKLCL